MIRSVTAEEQSFQSVEVADPFLEMHTGPGGGYPVFNIVERGEMIKIIMRRTSWFKIINKGGKQGWVSHGQMSLTLTPEGERIEFKKTTQAEFVKRNWELGVTGGEFGNATAVTLSGAYLFNKAFSAELGVSQAIGDVSSSWLFNVGLVMQPFPELRVSPFIHFGTGIIDVSPKSTLIQPVDRNNQFANIGIGIRAYLTKRFIVKLEYADYIVFSADIDNDTNEDVKEWKAGFSVFF